MAHLLWEVKNEVISETVRRVAEIVGPLDVVVVEYDPIKESVFFLFECDDTEKVLENMDGEVIN